MKDRVESSGSKRLPALYVTPEVKDLGSFVEPAITGGSCQVDCSKCCDCSYKCDCED